MIDADPMRVVNDPKLNEFIERLQQEVSGMSGGSTKKESAGRQFAEYLGIALLKLIEVLVEILV